MADCEGWLGFVEGAFTKEYQIHPTLEVDWIRMKLPSGKWKYSGKATLQGADGEARTIYKRIEKKLYARHRLIALAKDGTVGGLAKFRDWKNNPVLHKKRRREDERPDDTPENVDFGTHKENRNDPGNKKPRTYASGHPVILTNATTGETKPFASTLAAAMFLGANPGALCIYLNRKKGSGRKIPKYSMEGTWDAKFDEFELPGAVRLARAVAGLYLHPEHPNEVFRRLQIGKFCTTELKKGDRGYTQIPVTGGGKEYLHVLVVETLAPRAFESKLEVNPGLTREDLDVHHIDYDERNNAIGNLEVLTKGEHARKHAFEVEWLNARGKPIWIFECASDVVATVRGTRGQLLDVANVHKVCNRERKHTGGQCFRWKDADLVKAKRAAKLAKRV